MSTLSSSSTWAQVKAAYDDNASYEEDGSASKARAFVTACRIILRRLASRAANGDQEVEFDPKLIQSELNAARQYVATADPATHTGGVTFASFEDFR